jgi:hypothetical protein
MLSVLLLACHPDPQDPVRLEPSTPQGPTWDDVAPVLDRCAGCHDHSGLTVPITSWEEAVALAPSLRAAVSSRRMPPWPAAPAGVAYRDDPTLTDAEIELLVQWVDGGARPGTEDRPLLAPPAADLPRVDLALTYPEPYTPQGDPDDLRCFVLDTRELGDRRFLTGIQVVPGNREAAHHILVLRLVPTDAVNNPLVAAWSDPGPGFDCGGEITSSSFPGQYSGLGGWLPGRGALVLPEGSGIVLPEDALMLVEAHYYTPDGSAAPDLSTFQLMLQSEVQHGAAELKLSDSAWTDGALAVAAGQTATHETGGPISAQLAHLPELDASGGLVLHAVTPHMHRHGLSTRVTLEQDGEEIVLVDIPAWDFDWQMQYWLAEPLVLQADDVLSLSCTYRSEGPEDVLFGPGTDDEMCVTRLLVTEP